MQKISWRTINKTFIRNIFFATPLIGLLSWHSLCAQVSTPNGTSIEYQIYSPGNIAMFESDAAAWISARGWTSYITKIGGATGSYNCHSYAWYKSEGGSSNYWINACLESDYSTFNPYSYSSTPPSPNNIQKYWTDYSFFEVSNESEATKVWYGSCYQWTGYEWVDPCDHSAIRLASGLYESKWGKWPLYRHPADKCPYSLDNRRYFKKGPYISGPSIICPSGAEFIINNLPTVDSIIWTNGSSLTINSGQYSSTCTFASTGSASSWVRARIVAEYGSKNLPQIIVWSGPPQMPSISASLKNWGSYYEMRFFATQIDDATYQWKIDGDIQPFYGPFFSYVGSQCGGDPALIFRDYNVEVSVINNCDTTTTCRIFRYSCGYSPSISMIGYCGGGGYEEMMEENDISVLVAPNPANDNVKISICKKYLRLGNAFYENKNPALLPIRNKSYKLRILTSSGLPVYNSELTDNSISIATAGLKNGIYFVELNDGIKTFSQQFIIKH